MMDTTMIAAYSPYTFGAMALMYFSYQQLQGSRSALDAAMIDAMEKIATQLEMGNSMETAIMNISEDKTNKAAKHFKKIIWHVKAGKTLPEALDSAGLGSGSPTFRYVCQIIADAEKNKGDEAAALKELSKKLWDIQHLQETVDKKSSMPIMILQILGIFFLPIIYYFLASLLQTNTLDTVSMLQTPLMLGYLLAVNIGTTFLETFIFRDLLASLRLLPVSLSYYLLAISVIGPYIIKTMIGP